MLVNRIDNRMLSVLCDRIGLAFDVGHNPYRAFKREANSASPGYRRRMKKIAKRVEDGGSLADAFRAQGNYFPDDFVQMVEVGERTGRLEVVLQRLSVYYQDLAELRSEFVSAIIWPVLQLGLTIIIVGVMIYVPAIIAPDAGDILDMLGIGLVGARGLRIYLCWVGGASALLITVIVAYRNGRFSFLSHAVGYIPIVRSLVTIFPEARFVQALALSLDAGLDSWQSIDLAFKSAQSPLYDAQAERAKAGIRDGRDMHSVLARTGLLTADTLEAVKLGEESGRLPETLEKQFQFLRQQVKGMLTKFVYAASSVIWVIIVTILIFIIFRVFNNYLSDIESKLEGFV